MSRHLTTTAEVIDVLGGTNATSELTGRGANAVSNWRVSGEFPPSTYLLIGDKLRDLGMSADVGLWGFDREARQRQSAASEDVNGEAAS